MLVGIDRTNRAKTTLAWTAAIALVLTATAAQAQTPVQPSDPILDDYTPSAAITDCGVSAVITWMRFGAEAGCPNGPLYRDDAQSVPGRIASCDVNVPADDPRWGIGRQPCVAMVPLGYYVIAWKQPGNPADPGSPSDVYLRQYDANGGWGGEAVNVTPNTPGTSEASPAVALEGDRIVVAWAGDTGDGSRPYGIYAQCYLWTGVGLEAVGATIRVDDDPSWLPLDLEEAHPAVALAMAAADGTLSGRFIVAWNAEEEAGDKRGDYPGFDYSLEDRAVVARYFDWPSPADPPSAGAEFALFGPDPNCTASDPEVDNGHYCEALLAESNQHTIAYGPEDEVIATCAARTGDRQLGAEATPMVYLVGLPPAFVPDQSVVTWALVGGGRASSVAIGAAGTIAVTDPLNPRKLIAAYECAYTCPVDQQPLYTIKYLEATYYLPGAEFWITQDNGDELSEVGTSEQCYTYAHPSVAMGRANGILVAFTGRSYSPDSKSDLLSVVWGMDPDACGGISDCLDREFPVLGIPPGSTTVTCETLTGPDGNPPSMCWNARSPFTGSVPDSGYPLNINLFQGFGPPDYPPLSLDPESSSSPLVGQDVAYVRGPQPYRERPTQNNLIDLITGMPLLQETDFELPFGGAVFRHIRTYSENTSVMPLFPNVGSGAAPWSGSFWDWNGMFWMMSENPIFLIDAAYADPYGRPYLSENTRTCYFIPDAHHSIPFVRIMGSGGPEYVAPPGFDALLTYSGGSWDGATQEWATPPAEFYVWLNRRTVKYTITSIYEDLWIDPARQVSVHEAAHRNPTTHEVTGGRGIPYYGLVSQVEDRAGNRMEYTYCDRNVQACDDPDPVFSSLCCECCQNCNEKGQLKAIKLHRAGNSPAEWTLMYIHRAFPSSARDYSETHAEAMSEHALHSIRVYRGDKIVPPGCLTLPREVFMQQLSLPSGDPALILEGLDSINPEDYLPLESDWVIESRYLYSEWEYKRQYLADPPTVLPPYLGHQVFENVVPWLGSADDEWVTYVGNRLVKTTVTRRSDLGVVEKKYTMYRDGDGTAGVNAMAALKSVYTNATIDAILRGRKAAGGDGTNPNFLILTADEADVPVWDPAAQQATSKTLASLADVSMNKVYSGAPVQPQDAAWEAIVGHSVGTLVDHTLPVDFGRRTLIDRRASSKQNGTFVFYGFLSYPSTDFTWPTGSNWPPSSDLSWGTVFHHYPYRLQHPLVSDCAPGDETCQGLLQVPPNHPFFITVIDELDDRPGRTYNASEPSGLRSRRVVKMNSAGVVLQEKKWSYPDGSEGTLEQLGYAEEIKSDCKGRVKERRTSGWSVANNPNNVPPTNPLAEGLIYVYQYTDHCCGAGTVDDPCDCSNAGTCISEPPGELVAIGIKQGTNGDPYWLQRIERTIDGRPELITKEVRFPEPTPELGSASLDTTEYEYQFSQGPLEFPCIIGRTVKRPASAVGEGQTPTRPVEKTYTDTANRVEYHGVGRQDDSGLVEFNFEYTQNDLLGRPLVHVFDASAPPGGGALPGWARLNPAGLPALNETTTYEYDDTYGLVRTVFPNGRETRIVYLQGYSDPDVGDCPTCLCVWVFKDLIPASGSDPFRVLSPVQISVLRGDVLLKSRQIRLTATDTVPDGLGVEAANYELISESTPAFDANGRVVGVTQKGQDDTSVSAGISYDASGNPARSEGPDGTITRNVYDELGRLQRVFNGTNDIQEYWGTGITCDSNHQPPGCYEPGTFPDNMVLVEKRYYGTGVTDAGELTKIRHYRDRPQYQYATWDPALNNNQGGWVGGNPSDEDLYGWTTTQEYDWRMRPVCMIDRDSTVDGQDGAALHHQFTWYDNLDRPVLVAEFGSSVNLNGVPDPRTVAPEGWPPPGLTVTAAAQLLAEAQSAAPTSVTQTVYNARGQAEEVRQWYRSQPPGQPAEAVYTATRTYYDHADRTVEVHAPDSPVQRHFYDAKGRQVQSSSFAGDNEITRTTTSYDDNDRAVCTTSWERKHDATDPQLGGANCVRSFTYTWYDQAGKVIATASFGTNSNAFGNASDPPTYDDTTPPVTIDPGTRQVTGLLPGAYAGALITGYAYDGAGRQSTVFHPDGTVTRTEYDDLGRVLLVTENADPQSGQPVQRTAYLYDADGRLSKMAAVKPENFTGYANINWTQPDPSIQTTEFIYGADVVDSNHTAISANNAFIREVRFPGRADGYPTAADALWFSYYSDGSVASRTDQRGMVFSHAYDELGRRISTDIDDGAWYACPLPDQPDNRPANRPTRIEYAYSGDGSLSQVTAMGHRPDGTIGVLAQNIFMYDERHNLIADRQAHGGTVATNTPTTGYAWSFSPATEWNFNRLSTITYPLAQAGSTPALTFGYGGNPTDPTARLDRIRQLTWNGTPNELVAYDYAGLSRRVGTTWGDGVVTQSFAGGSGYAGLDRFGRILDLHFQQPNPTWAPTIHRYQYDYDLAGNRTYALVTQRLTPQTLLENMRSYAYVYDQLNRLVDARMGKLAFGADGPHILAAGVDGAPIPRTTAWNLDNLGNWSGGEPDPAGVIRSVLRTGDFDRNGLVETQYLHHQVNEANEIASLQENGNEASFVYDLAGNLTFDRQRVYQYDALNRLIQVNALGTVTFDQYGRIASGRLGDLICRYVYDGLGRLISKQTPINVGSTNLQTKDFYYDGVRRIQEQITRPMERLLTYEPGTFLTEGPGVPDSGGIAENDELALQRADGLTPDQELLETNVIVQLDEVWTDRAYIYGPDYVDEFVAQIDRYGNVMYMLQDANYNVVALVSGGGHGTPQPGGDTLPFQPAGYLLEQYTYDPYGSVVACENFDLDGTGKSLHAVNRVGHQGLFFERFDGSYIDQTLAEGGLPSQLATARATGLYYNRNRFYHPQLGRFMTRDPNETGMPIIAAIAMNGEAVSVLLGGFDAEGLYGDGMNLYRYAGSNPIGRRDSLGLDYEDSPFYEIDSLVKQITGERQAAIRRAIRVMRALGRAAGKMALQTAIMVLVPGGGLVVAAWNMYDSVQDIYENNLTWGNAFGLGLSALGLWGEVANTVDAIRSMEGEITSVYRGAVSRVLERRGYLKEGSFDMINVRRLPRRQLLRRPPSRGRPPYGLDNRPVEIHHVDQDVQGPFVEILAGPHRRVPSPKPGLTDEQRALFKEARKRYWEREWDSGRFDDLPR